MTKRALFSIVDSQENSPQCSTFRPKRSSDLTERKNSRLLSTAQYTKNVRFSTTETDTWSSFAI